MPLRRSTGAGPSGGSRSRRPPNRRPPPPWTRLCTPPSPGKARRSSGWRSNENQRQLLERLEQRLRTAAVAPDVAGDMAALRSAAAHHGQQIVSLATAVHRLAKLLAANTVLGR